jgi:hypothetical protein
MFGTLIPSVVILHTPGGNQMASGKTDGQGQVSFSRLSPGEYLLTINALGVKTRREISLHETTRTKYGVTLSVFTLSISLAVCCIVTVIFYYSYPRPGPTLLNKPEPARITNLKLVMEYRLIMEEIREKEVLAVNT